MNTTTQDNQFEALKKLTPYLAMKHVGPALRAMNKGWLYCAGKEPCRVLNGEWYPMFLWSTTTDEQLYLGGIG